MTLTAAATATVDRRKAQRSARPVTVIGRKVSQYMTRTFGDAK